MELLPVQSLNLLMSSLPKTHLPEVTLLVSEIRNQGLMVPSFLFFTTWISWAGMLLCASR